MSQIATNRTEKLLTTRIREVLLIGVLPALLTTGLHAAGEIDDVGAVGRQDRGAARTRWSVSARHAPSPVCLLNPQEQTFWARLGNASS